jgi:hypothetical protein
MRQTMMGLAVAFAAAASAAPASACGYSGCNTPSWNYNYSGFYGNYSYPACNACGTSYGTPWRYGHLPYPAQPYASAPQYYWVNQGPTYTGPGLLAPAPTYQERAVSGWDGYGPTSYGTQYSYGGGPYRGYQGDQGYQGYQPQGYSDDQTDATEPSYQSYAPTTTYSRPYPGMVTPRYYSSYRFRHALRFHRHVGWSRYSHRMSIRYGVPHLIGRGRYAPRYGFTVMPRHGHRMMPVYN